MSQEKVDRYKKEKAGRKQELAKKKRKRTLQYIGGILGSIVLIVAIIFSAKLLRGDFKEEPTSSYSQEQLSYIKGLFGGESESTNAEQDTTKP